MKMIGGYNNDSKITGQFIDDKLIDQCSNGLKRISHGRDDLEVISHSNIISYINDIISHISYISNIVSKLVI